MSEVETHGCQEHPNHPCFRQNGSIHSLIAMPVVADDRMTNVLQMPPNLVRSAR
jgi:hypothetical protein